MKGSVTLESSRGDLRTINAGDPDAGYPISHVRPSPYEVIAAEGSELLRIEGSKLRSHQAQHKPARFFADEEVAGLEWIGHPLVNRLIQQARNGNLALPAMPGIALRVRKSLEKDDFRLEEIATIISADPAIVARLLNVANSVFYRCDRSCDSVKAA